MPTGTVFLALLKLRGPYLSLACFAWISQTVGYPFNPLTRAEPDLNASLDERPVGGLGIFLIRRLTQSVEYRREGNWNRLHFEMS